jgi:transcriptional regulator with XRE-family HTH domain
MSYSRKVGARLRSIRKQKGLTLQQVEVLSNKRLKGSLLAAYERGDRNISVTRLQQISHLYATPIQELLPEDLGLPDEGQEPLRVSIDLEQLASLPERQAGPLAKHVHIVQEQRQAPVERVLTIRTADLENLAAAYHTTPEVLKRTLREWGVSQTGELEGQPPVASELAGQPEE